jgi:hypothetical protein
MRRAHVQVTFAVAISNHHHTGIHDPGGNFPAFVEHFRHLTALPGAQKPGLNPLASGVPPRASTDFA